MNKKPDKFAALRHAARKAKDRPKGERTEAEQNARQGAAALFAKKK